MAEMLIQSESLTSIADKIRVLNGIEGAMTTAQMNSNLGEANTDVATEAELIAQITSALDGKAAGGSGGIGIDVAQVTINFNNFINIYAATCYTEYNEKLHPKYLSIFENNTINVVCGVMNTLIVLSATPINVITSGNIITEHHGEVYDGYIHIISFYCIDSSNCSILISPDTSGYE